MFANGNLYPDKCKEDTLNHINRLAITGFPIMMDLAFPAIILNNKNINHACTKNTIPKISI